MKDIVYTISTNNAQLPHQADGVEMFQGKVIKKADGLYFRYDKLLCSVGKRSYSQNGGTFSSIGVIFKIAPGWRKVFRELFDAKIEMLNQMFKKKSWLK